MVEIAATCMYLRYIPYHEYIIKMCDVQMKWTWARMLDMTVRIWDREA